MGKPLDPVSISKSSRVQANCGIIRLSEGIFAKAIGMSQLYFQGICEVFGINVGKEEHVGTAGPHHFQNLIKYFGRHNEVTK